MSKARKRVLGSLCVGFGLMAGLAIYSALPQGVTASADSFNSIAGENFDENDYTFVGYALQYEEEGAVNSNSANSAMRFKMEISAEMYTYLSTTSGAKTGTLIYPAYYLESQDVANLTVESKAGANNDILPIDLDTTNAWAEQTGGAYQSVTYLKEIPAEYYTANIAVRGYLQVGNTYYYTTPSTARSFAYVANAEKNDPESPFNAQEKEAFSQLFLTFPVRIDGETQVKSYGDTIAAKENEFNKVFLHYEENGRVFTAGTSTLFGRADLTSVWAEVKEYYSQAKGSATFDVEGLPAGITTANLNGRSIPCSSTEGKLTVSNLEGLEMGENYLITAESGGTTYNVAFKNVAEIDNNVPYAAGDELVYDLKGAAIDIVQDEQGNEVYTDGGLILTSIGQNSSSTVQEKIIFIMDTTRKVHKVNLRVFTKVLYDGEQAIEYFIGTEAGDYQDSTMRNGLNVGCYALGADVDLGSMPLVEKKSLESKNVVFTGLFDGCGHTLSWTVDGNASTKGESSLFGYYMAGILQNVKLDVAYTKNTSGTPYIVSNFVHNSGTPTSKPARIDNVVFDLSFAEGMTDKTVTIGATGNTTTTYGVTMVDCLMLRSGSAVETGKNLASKLLLDYTGVLGNTEVTTNFTQKGNTVTQETTAGSGEYFVKSDYVNMDGVVCVVPNGVTGLLGNGGGGSTNTNVLYYRGENQQLSTPPKTGWLTNVYYKGASVYTYDEAKTAATKVGNWVITYGNSITEIAATFEK